MPTWSAGLLKRSAHPVPYSMHEGSWICVGVPRWLGILVMGAACFEFTNFLAVDSEVMRTLIALESLRKPRLAA